VLQQEYLRYLAGTFDELLPDTERSSVRPSPMTPQRLYDFLANEWADNHHREAERDRDVARIRALSRGVDEFEGLRAELDHDVQAAETAHRRACASTDDARQSLTELHSALEIVRASKREYEQQLKRWRDEESRLADHESRFRHVQLTDGIRQKLTEANQLLDRLVERKPSEEKRLHRTLEDQDYWRKELLKRRRELGVVSRRIHNLKLETNELRVEPAVH
jgi:chromosome segregation ATPase